MELLLRLIQDANSRATFIIQCLTNVHIKRSYIIQPNIFRFVLSSLKQKAVQISYSKRQILKLCKTDERMGLNSRLVLLVLFPAGTKR